MFSRSRRNFYLFSGIATLLGVGIFTVQAQQASQPHQIRVKSSSGSAELALAAHLRNVNAKLYGAYWCVHCYEQMYLFGGEAAQKIDRVECAEDRKDAQPKLCQEAEIKAYPTWKIDGKVYQGIQSLEDLATASGYQGDRSFKNAMPTAIPKN
jgi:hypothetical protein